MSKGPSGQGHGSSRARALRDHWGAVWFHVIGAAILTLPQLFIGGDNSVCVAWDSFNMAGTVNLGCASKTYLALLIGLSALWLTVFALPLAINASPDTSKDNPVALSEAHEMAGLTARFAVFFAISMVALESVAHVTQWAAPLVG